MTRIEIREMEYFQAVAEELNFSRAAERLGMAQPPLSRAIARLEQRLGVRLFERTSRRTTLTDAGRVLSAGTANLLQTLDRVVERARAASPKLVVAVPPGIGGGFMSETVKRYEERSASRVEVLLTDRVRESLADGAADLALVCGTESLEHVRSLDVGAELQLALVPTGHPFAGRGSVEVAELEADPLFASRAAGVTLTEIIDLVAFGHLATMVGASARGRVGSGVASVPVRDAPPIPIRLVWRRNGVKPEVAAFIRVARETGDAQRNALAGIPGRY